MYAKNLSKMKGFFVFNKFINHIIKKQLELLTYGGIDLYKFDTTSRKGYLNYNNFNQ